MCLYVYVAVCFTDTFYSMVMFVLECFYDEQMVPARKAFFFFFLNWVALCTMTLKTF